MNKIINADCLDVIWQQTKPVMIFADPPDNLGLKYDGFAGKWPNDEAYLNWLYQVIGAMCLLSPIVWVSYYYKWDFALKGLLWSGGQHLGRNIKPYIWWYTFSQHNKHDNGSCFRPMLRITEKHPILYPDAIREPSARQREYNDKRANPDGRVPGDVWNGVWKESRVCGSFKEKRKWGLNQHPEALIERMILLSTKPGDLVIDMFAGTGTVNRVCKRLDRDCIGIEISKTYCEKIVDELGCDFEKSPMQGI